MSVKTQFGRLASVGTETNGWTQVQLSPCTADGVVIEGDLIRAYASKDFLLTFGQICAVQIAKAGDKIKVQGSGFTDSSGKKYSKGEEFTYESDSTRVIGVGMQSVQEIQAQLDRVARMTSVRLPAGDSLGQPFQVTAGEPVKTTELVDA